MEPENYFSFDPTILDDLVQRRREEFAKAEPFPHAVFDNFLPREVAQRVLDEFPAVGEPIWSFHDNHPLRRGKYMSRDETQMSDYIRHLLYNFNSARFICFLEKLSGITPLLPDPDISGTLRHFRRGGRLGIHVDYNWHEKLLLYRRLNIILYLAKDWKPEYGGALELWDAKMKHCVKKVVPAFNRCIIFHTTETSYHGFPDPLNCPEGETRRSFQLYYFTSKPSRKTVFFRPHSTIFKFRQQDSALKKAGTPRVFSVLKKVAPPVFIDLGKWILRKTR